MAAGSVIVDLAAEQGGNVALTKAGEVVDVDGVSIIGYRNVAGRLPSDASSLYARNVFNFVSTFFDKENGAFPTDWDDEIIKGIALVKSGAIVHPGFSDEKASSNSETGEEKSSSADDENLTEGQTEENVEPKGDA